MVQYVPYIEGMHEGQGFNSYSQEPAGFNVITIVQESTETPGYEIRMGSEYISEYQKLAQSKEITVGAAIRGWGLSAMTGYLNRSEFEMSDFTYEVHVSIKKQSSGSRSSYKFNWYPEKRNEVHKYYGDRFISGFLTGGDYFARCSVKMSSNWNRTEWKTRVGLAFSMFGVQGNISPEVKDAVESLHKNAQIKITRLVRGGGSMSEADTITDLLALREEALMFYNNPDRQNFRISAIVEDYFKLPNFTQEYFTPLNYSYARAQSWPLFDDFTLWTHLDLLIDSIPEEAFSNGNKRQWQSECLEQEKNLVDGIEQVVEDPEKLGRVMHWPRRKPSEYMAKLMGEVSSKYELRSILVEERFDRYTPRQPMVFTAGWTAAIFPDGAPSDSGYETIVGKFRAFSFQLPGTLLVSLGYLRPEDCLFHWGSHGHDATSRSGYWITRAQTGIHIPDGDVIRESSYFWAFPSDLPQIIQESVNSGAMQRMNFSIANDPPRSGASPKSLLNISIVPISRTTVSRDDQVLHVPELGYTQGYQLNELFSVHVLAETV